MNIYLHDPRRIKSVEGLQKLFRSHGNGINQQFIPVEPGSAEEIGGDIDDMSYLDVAIIMVDPNDPDLQQLAETAREIKKKLPILFLTNGQFPNLRSVFADAFKLPGVSAVLDMKSGPSMQRFPATLARLSGAFHGDARLKIPVGDLILDRTRREFLYPDGRKVPLEGDAFRVLEYLAMRLEQPVSPQDCVNYVLGSKENLENPIRDLGVRLTTLRKTDLGSLNLLGKEQEVPNNTVMLSQYSNFKAAAAVFLQGKREKVETHSDGVYGIMNHEGADMLISGGLVFHATVPALLIDNKITPLTTTEQKILHCLISANGEAPGYAAFGLDQTPSDSLKELKSKLRKKLGAYQDIVQVARGENTPLGLPYYYIDKAKMYDLHRAHPTHPTQPQGPAPAAPATGLD